MNNELAVKVFDALYDEDDLKELHEKKIIAQPLGFKLSTIATIECELDAYHDRLTEENAKFREFAELVATGDSAGDNAKSIMVNTYIHNAKQLLNQLE